jgi:hypothetical protein
MDIHDASGIILRMVHEDLEGKLVWSAFIQKQTTGYNDQTANELKGTYYKALIILIDEGLCHKIPNSDIVELAQKGIEAKGDFHKYFKKKKTRNTLEKLRRIAPIVSAIIVIISFIITIVTKNAKKSAAQKAATQKTQPAAPNKTKEPRR